MANLERHDEQALLHQGIQQFEAGDYENALISFDGAVKLNSKNYEAWRRRADTLRKLERYQEALESCNISLEINPTDYESLYRRSTVFHDLKNYEKALEDSKLAIEMQPDCHLGWIIQGHILLGLKQYQEAVKHFNRAIELKPDDHYAWYGRGAALLHLAVWEKNGLPHLILEGIQNSSYALSLQPDFYLAQSECKIEETISDKVTWFHYSIHGSILLKLKRYEEAKLYFDRILDIDKNDISNLRIHLAAMMEMKLYKEAFGDFEEILKINPNLFETIAERGTLLYTLERYEDAILDYDKAIEIKPNYWKAWNGLGLAILFSSVRAPSQRFIDALNKLNIGLQRIDPTADDCQEGRGRLHDSIGFVFYQKGKSVLGDFTDLLEAKKHYYLAQDCLNTPQLLQFKLEVLQSLMQACNELGETKDIFKLRSQGTVILEQLRKQPHLINGDIISVFRKFASFDQYIVDELIHSGKPTEALEFAEQRKNTCLSWLKYPSIDNVENAGFTKYQQIKQLLKPDTAIIYWHLSPVSLTTFILRHNQDPLPLHQQRTLLGIFSKARIDGSITARQLKTFDQWMKKWKGYYEKYRNKKLKSEKTVDEIPRHLLPVEEGWQENMKAALDNLRDNILDINEILKHLDNRVTQLILIPHRELHLLPLEYLFPERFTITRLPSAQIGINLQQLQLTAEKRLLSVESPSRLLFAEIESGVIAQLYHPHLTPIPSHSATKQQVTVAISAGTNCFHFTGHGYHNLDSPTESALQLANGELLTLSDIFKLNFEGYDLVCLSACETGVTSKQGIIDEYVGLASGFLAVGVAHVVSTLWTVEEISAALMMIKFHQLFKDGIPPAEALKQAKYWLRTITYAKLAEWYLQNAEIVASFNRNCRRDLEDEAERIKGDRAKMESTKPPYAHPYYWAGFTVTGKANY